MIPTQPPIPGPDVGPAAEAAAHSGRVATPPETGQPADWLLWAVETAARTFAADLTFYLLGAGLAFLVLWVALRRRLAHRRIDPAYPEARHLRREFLFSLASMGVFAVLGVALTGATLAGWTRIYVDIGIHGWVYWSVSIAALLVLHDAYFYWTHRLMHHRLVFGRVHRLHHRSHNPSPWAAYAFAPAEALVQGLFLTATAFVLPLHPSAILVFVLHQIFRNALGHSGFEIYPASWQRLPILKWINSTSHHHLHHSKGGGNYGLYFLWWDRLMGTEHPDSAATFARASAARATRETGRP